MARAQSDDRVLAESCGSGRRVLPSTPESTDDDLGTDGFGNEYSRRFADKDDTTRPLDKLFR